MKTITIAIITSLGLAGAGLAQQGARKNGEGPRFSRLDTNGDGVLSKDEWLAGPAKRIQTPRRADTRFGRIDADGDGAVDRAEFAKHRRQRERAGKGGPDQGKGEGKGGRGPKGPGRKGARG